MKKFLIVLTCLFAVMLGVLWTTELSDPEPDYGDFNVTMLNTGQGLSVLITADGQSMLYDGGGRSTSSYVVSYLKEKEISSLEYLAASHYDEDHISGLIGVMETAEVKKALTPDYTGETWLYDAFCTHLKDKGIEEIHPAVNDIYELGQAVITVVGPEDYKALAENNRSIALLIEYRDFRVLLTGDAEVQEEEGIVQRLNGKKCDLLAAGHHGSFSSTSQQLLDTVHPSYVWISCGIANDYGHPHASVMERLQKENVQMFRTDLQDEISLHYDGYSVSFNTDPCTDYSAGEDTKKSIVIPEELHPDEYVLNIHTMKFHLPSCTSVSSMKEKNREDVTEDREILIQMGYTPCGACNP